MESVIFLPHGKRLFKTHKGLVGINTTLGDDLVHSTHSGPDVASWELANRSRRLRPPQASPPPPGGQPRPAMSPAPAGPPRRADVAAAVGPYHPAPPPAEGGGRIHRTPCACRARAQARLPRCTSLVASARAPPAFGQAHGGRFVGGATGRFRVSALSCHLPPSAAQGNTLSCRKPRKSSLCLRAVKCHGASRFPLPKKWFGRTPPR